MRLFFLFLCLQRAFSISARSINLPAKLIFVFGRTEIFDSCRACAVRLLLSSGPVGPLNRKRERPNPVNAGAQRVVRIFNACVSPSNALSFACRSQCESVANAIAPNGPKVSTSSLDHRTFITELFLSIPIYPLAVRVRLYLSVAVCAFSTEFVFFFRVGSSQPMAPSERTNGPNVMRWPNSGPRCTRRRLHLLASSSAFFALDCRDVCCRMLHGATLESSKARKNPMKRQSSSARPTFRNWIWTLLLPLRSFHMLSSWAYSMSITTEMVSFKFFRDKIIVSRCDCPYVSGPSLTPFRSLQLRKQQTGERTKKSGVHRLQLVPFFFSCVCLLEVRLLRIK